MRLRCGTAAQPIAPPAQPEAARRRFSQCGRTIASPSGRACRGRKQRARHWLSPLAIFQPLFLAVITPLPEMSIPLFQNFIDTSFDYAANIRQNMALNPRSVISQEALARTGDPEFCRVRHWRTLRNMHVNRLYWIALVRPKVDPVRASSKNLRHCQSPLSRRIQLSGAPRIAPPPQAA